MTLLMWLVFAFLCVVLARDFGLPVRLAQAIQGALLLIMLLVLAFGLSGRTLGQAPQLAPGCVNA